MSKLCVKFLWVWMKTIIAWKVSERILKIFDENSVEKSNSYLFFGKVDPKNSLRKQHQFSTTFFPVQTEGLNPHPMRTPLLHATFTLYLQIILL